MVVRVEYDRSNGVRTQRTGNRPSNMQSPRGANFSTGGRPPTSPAGAGNNPGQVVHTRASVTKLQYNSVPVKGRPMPWE